MADHRAIAQRFVEAVRKGARAADRKEESGDAPAFDFIDSATFMARDCRPEWAIPRLVVRNQPAVLGGPAKSLKTTILIDMAVAMGAPTNALGYFPTPPAQLNVGVLSGESGEAALQNTFKRVCAARGINPADVSVFWGFRLPSLADPAHLDALVERARERCLDVLAVDPLYLSLMAGLKGADFDAKNLYDVGPLLAEFSRRVLAIGVTPLLCHHFKTTRENHYAEPDLGDLTYAGIREYARQWILVGRRSKYEHDGRHRLHLVAGGSVGHSYAYALDVNEGVMAEDFTGRVWETTVQPAGDVRRHEQDEKSKAKSQEAEGRRQADEMAVMAALDKLDPDRRGAGVERVRHLTGFSRDRMSGAVTRLAVQEMIRRLTVDVPTNNGATKAAEGIVRVDG